MASSIPSRFRLSTLAVVSAAVTLGSGLAGGAAAAATPGPSVGETLSGTGGTMNSAGDVFLMPLSDSGTAAVNVAYTATPGNTTPGGPGDGLTSLVVTCGQPGLAPIVINAPNVGGASGTTTCNFTVPGLYQVKITATDNQTPAVTSSMWRFVSIRAGAKVGVDRYDGTTRYGTGIAVSRAAFPASGSAGAVVLARGDMFADALAGIPLAKYKNAPLLLTPGGAGVQALDSNVEAEITRVLPRDKSHTVYILGGTGAISQTIENYIGSTLGYNVVRLHGDTRYQTALAIAEDPRGLNNPTHVVVARGDDFADALAAGPYASNADKDGNGTPAAIVLSDGPTGAASIDPATAAFIESRFAADPGTGAYQTVTAIGGGAHSAVEKLPGAYAPGNHFWGIWGPDRWSTATDVASEGWGVNGQGSHSSVEGLATGMSFPDALTGGAYMALKNGPLLLTETSTLSTAPSALVRSGTNSLIDVAAFGGTSVLTPDVVNGIAAAVQPKTIVYTEHHMLF